MTAPSATVIKDSISPDGQRSTSIEVTMHRYVLAEANTHRTFSRNSASSRAIPVRKQLERFTNDVALPVEWPSEQPGMQGGTLLEGDDLEMAQALFATIHGHTSRIIDAYLLGRQRQFGDKEAPKHTLHKSLINRLMEWGLWHTALITSTEWAGFWEQRSREHSMLAQPEMAAAADAMYVAYRASEPEHLDYGQWHLPYVDEPDLHAIAALAIDRHEAPAVAFEWAKQVSASRCARTSYLTQHGVRDIAEDIEGLFRRLVSAKPLHASPLEHQATPVPERLWLTTPGNLTGWRQFRHEVEPRANWAYLPRLALAERQAQALVDLERGVLALGADERDRSWI